MKTKDPKKQWILNFVWCIIMAVLFVVTVAITI